MYTRDELDALQTVLSETLAKAERRAAIMPTSAEVIRRRAAEIRSVSDKILRTMPDIDPRNYTS